MKLTSCLTAALILSSVSCDNAGSNEQRAKESTDSVQRADSMATTMPTPTTTSTDPTTTSPDSTAMPPDEPQGGDPTRKRDRKRPTLK